MSAAPGMAVRPRFWLALSCVATLLGARAQEEVALPSGVECVALLQTSLQRSEGTVQPASLRHLESEQNTSAVAFRSPAQNVSGQSLPGEVVPGPDQPPRRSARNFIVAYSVAWLVVVGLVAYLCAALHKKFNELNKATGSAFDHGFVDYLHYKFGHWFVWTGHSKEVVLVMAFLVSILVVSSVYSVFVGCTIGTSIYQSFNMLVDPGGAQAQTTFAGQVIGVPASILGLIIFAVLLAVVQDRFSNYLESLAGGCYPIVEKDHIVLLGFCDATVTLIRELCMRYANSGGTTIAVLSDLPKADVEAKIQSADIALFGSKVAVRSGSVHHVSDLKRVSAGTCARIVLMPDRALEKDTRDAFIIQALIALSSQGWPHHGRTVVGYSFSHNSSLFETIGGEKVDVVMLDDFMAKMLCKCSGQPGITSIIDSICGFEDSDLYVTRLPAKLVGRTFGEVALHYPRGVPIGVMSEKGGGKLASRLCPGSNYTLKSGDSVLAFLADAGDLPEDEPYVLPPRAPSEVIRCLAAPRSVRTEAQLETVMILGWNELIGSLMSALDSQVAAGSKVIVFATCPVEDRDEYIRNYKETVRREFVQITSVEHIVGKPGNRTELEAVRSNFEEAARCFILADETAENVEDADSCTMATIMQIHDLLKGASRPPRLPIVPELRSTLSAELCEKIGLLNFVNSSRTPAKVMANLVVEPRLAPALLDLTTEGDGADIEIRPIADYISQDAASVPTSLCFWEAARLVNATGHILAGWSVANESGAAEQEPRCAQGRFKARIADLMSSGSIDKATKFEINPLDKSTVRPWSQERDFLVVIIGTQLEPLS